MTLTRSLTEDKWRDRCFGEIAELSLAAGVSVEEARDGAILINGIIRTLGQDFRVEPILRDGRAADFNVIRLADVRGQR